MPGWPSIATARDQWLARSLRSANPTALPELYDTYAPRLFDHCTVLLGAPEAAGPALHDYLVALQERARELPDLRVFRVRLYAVTRRECLRRRTLEEPPQRLRQAPEAVTFDPAETARRFARAALLLLDEPLREAVELSLRHELEPLELAEVLSITPDEAAAQVARGRHTLGDAFAAVVVTATGRDECPHLAAPAGPGGGRRGTRGPRRPICSCRKTAKAAEPANRRSPRSQAPQRPVRPHRRSPARPAPRRH